MNIRQDLLRQLEKHILQKLESQPQGISEHTLLKHLAVITDESGKAIFENRFNSDLSLFQAHFLLFHLLYRLKLRLFAEKRHYLAISPLNIQLQGWDGSAAETFVGDGANVIAAADPLATYYLDLTHLEQTDADDVDKLLNQFYQGLKGGDYRQEALETLGLADPVDHKTIKKRYRELAMQHHPDRGGDTQTLQAINQAFAKLMP